MQDYRPWYQLLRVNYEALSWREAQAIVDDVADRTPERVEMLERHIRTFAGFSEWTADGSRDSFRQLGPWVMQHTRRRELLPHEKVFEPLNPTLSEWQIESLQSLYTSMPVRYFTEHSRGVLCDIGLYIAQCIHMTHPTTKWIRCKCRGDDLFNMPLLGVARNYGICPFFHTLNAASQQLKTLNTNRWLELLETWLASASSLESRRVDKWW